jgi:hypothetical protein
MTKPEWMSGGRDLIREQVRERDKYQCQNCKKKWKEGTRRFDIHHLNGVFGRKSRGYDRKVDIKKLITLCHRCHLNLPEVRNKMKLAYRKAKRQKVDKFPPTVHGGAGVEKYET